MRFRHKSAIIAHCKKKKIRKHLQYILVRVFLFSSFHIFVSIGHPYAIIAVFRFYFQRSILIKIIQHPFRPFKFNSSLYQFITALHAFLFPSKKRYCPHFTVCVQRIFDCFGDAGNNKQPMGKDNGGSTATCHKKYAQNQRL